MVFKPRAVFYIVNSILRNVRNQVCFKYCNICKCLHIVRKCLYTILILIFNKLYNINAHYLFSSRTHRVIACLALIFLYYTIQQFTV